MTAGIVGREQELERVHAFLDSPAEGVSALVLEGEAGIGKSTLWLAGVEHARERGYLRPLVAAGRGRARPCPRWGWAISSRASLDDVLPALAPPRRRALEVALLLEEASGGAVDHRALAVAVRDVLQLLGESGPLVVAVDDVQWLDPASSTRARVRAATARRRPRARAARPAARRRGAGRRSSSRRSTRSASSGCRSGRSASARCTGSCATGSAGPSRARRCSASTSARAGTRSSRWSWPAFSTRTSTRSQPLPVPETLEELVRARLAGLPASTREALALASALGTPSESLLERAGVAADALDPAVAAHVIERENGTIRFTHPLLSSVLYQDLGDERRSVHATHRGDRRRPAPPRPSPRAVDGRARRRRRRGRSTTPRRWRPIAARRPSRPSSPSRRSG